MVQIPPPTPPIMIIRTTQLKALYMAKFIQFWVPQLKTDVEKLGEGSEESHEDG